MPIELTPTAYEAIVGDYTYRIFRVRNRFGRPVWTVMRCVSAMNWHSVHVQTLQRTGEGELVWKWTVSLGVLPRTDNAEFSDPSDAAHAIDLADGYTLVG